MKEDLLHYVWRHQKLPLHQLCTTDKESIILHFVGEHNTYEGPDFIAAKLSVGSQLWAGNVEIHVKSSDWYAHHHEEDPRYQNVILHVVWEHDMPVFRQDNSVIPTLELKAYVSASLLQKYKSLLHRPKKKFINCEKDIAGIPPFLMSNWLERLYIERLEQKVIPIKEILAESANNWEQVLFCFLCKNFGLNINGEAFLSAAKAVPYHVIQKTRHKELQLEALLFGVLGMLDKEEDVYVQTLHKEFQFLKSKFALEDATVTPAFFKLRPSNFPTIRLAQLAQLYFKNENLFSVLTAAKTKEEMYNILEVGTSDYWQTHFVFGKTSKMSTKRLSNSFKDLLIINTILPIKFCYQQYKGKGEVDDLFAIIRSISLEKNSIVEAYKQLSVPAKTAMESQALLQLHHFYCTKNNCLQCAVGGRLLSGNN